MNSPDINQPARSEGETNMRLSEMIEYLTYTGTIIQAVLQHHEVIPWKNGFDPRVVANMTGDMCITYLVSFVDIKRVTDSGGSHMDTIKSLLRYYYPLEELNPEEFQQAQQSGEMVRTQGELHELSSIAKILGYPPEISRKIYEISIDAPHTLQEAEAAEEVLQQLKKIGQAIETTHSLFEKLTQPKT